ncbi:tRNA (adenine(22)-N(1))-methyltransferase [Sporosarcina aquimarina]|uniref:tRNA (Adenine(22)-N(1))-methyltransferase TrmK n=1 Tax=Sporosarcina aquimarina TaxID=114975 RepID=A0ABU4FZX6_9BACL|nr:tRNA (adenine(22)-N(1))-methyltransferase TrmK [Sporosarcina aquimarina]MDW0108967.1 tRNA (adenine(22)-N(1))-methyltransferase TrmK [Sporosarcina aquimarina]
MNAKNLSERLKLVASFVEQGTVLADIGSDHAYLPCWLIQNGLISRAIAGEVVKGPFESAKRNVQSEGLGKQITVRMANGLRAIEQNDSVETVTIAGMGGSLIASILDNDSERLASVKRIIVQPNIHSMAIRQWAVDNSWKIVNEAIVKEDRKIYEVLVLEPGKGTYSSEEMLMGPYLIKECADAFLEKWQGELAELSRVITALTKSAQSEEAKMKRQQLSETKDLIERVLHK